MRLSKRKEIRVKAILPLTSSFRNNSVMPTFGPLSTFTHRPLMRLVKSQFVGWERF